MDLRARSWYQTNTFPHTPFTAERLAAERRSTVSVCLPARNESQTIAAILTVLNSLRERGVIDQIAVVDGSTDDTPQIARNAGAEVYAEDRLLPEQGPAIGKGDAMWRSLSVLTGEVICYLDADSEDFGEHYVCGLLGPLLLEDGPQFVKGFYERPFRTGSVTMSDGGGRVTELTARPLLNLFYPELAYVRQPLSGEIAARRSLLERLPFTTGYGVDVGLLIDAHERVGLDGIAQVDLGTRLNAHQSLPALSRMAFEVLTSVSARLERAGRLEGPLPSTFIPVDLLDQSGVELQVLDRPPFAELRAAA